MARRLPRPVDYRAVYVRTQTPEEFPAVELDSETGAYFTLLREAPSDPTNPDTPMTVTVAGAARARVTGAPAPGEYRVRTATVGATTEWLPVLEFNAADLGRIGTCDYYRGGSVYTRPWMERLHSFSRPLQATSLAALQADSPAQSDAWTRGGPLDLAIVAGVLYYSNGVEWLALAGGVAGNVGAQAGIGPAVAPVQALPLGGKGGAAGAIGPASAPPSAQAPHVTIGAAPGGATGDVLPADAPLSPGVLSATGKAAAGVAANAPITAQPLNAVGNASGGGTGPLLPPNPNFDTDITATGEQANAWWKEQFLGDHNAGVAVAGQFASTEMTGSYVGHLLAQPGYWDDGMNFGWDIASALLSFVRTKAEIDATGGVLTFDLRPKAQNAPGYAVIRLHAFDAGNVEITNGGGVTGDAINLWGAPAADTTIVGATTVNVTQTVSFNLKTWMSNHLTAGKTWADVAKVIVSFETSSTGSAANLTNEFYIDNFR